MTQNRPQRLRDLWPDLDSQLTHGGESPARFAVSQIRCETLRIPMRDGVRLATDVYRPPLPAAPAILLRAPYSRANDKFVGAFLAFARRGFAVVAQDCRGTGDSEPDRWDYYMYESEDGFDLVEWVSQQSWCNGFIASCGGSYVGQTQWCMALHPCMTTIAPEVSGLGVVPISTAHFFMLLNAYARSVGKGQGKLAVHYSQLERLMREETLASGYFNEPLHQPFSQALLENYPEVRSLPPAQAKRRLWERYCALPSAQRATFVKQALGTQSVSVLEVEHLSAIFGHEISHDAHSLPHADPAKLCQSLEAPPLMITGWYDWALNDALATWELLRREATAPVRSRARLIITPSAHNVPGYHEGMDTHPELQRTYRMENNVGLLLRWYATVRDGTTDSWPTVIYYLMGANEWRVASEWPVPESQQLVFYLAADRVLTRQAPQEPSDPDRYTYDPQDPTPTVGGSIVSHVYPPGSVDVSEVQKRPDVLVFTTAPLECDLDVVGPLHMILYASSSAIDTDFSVRLSDVFPDGRAIQLQSGILRARYRSSQPELLEPGRVYRFEIDLLATANRFKAGHRLRLDISSADFPRFDRHTNRAGEPGPPLRAEQAIFHDPERPSHVLLRVLDRD